MGVLDWAIVIPLVFVAGLVRGMTGFAGPLILVPVLGFFYGPVSAIATATLVDLSCNASLLRSAFRNASRPTVGLLVLGASITIPAGAWAMLSFDVRTLSRIVYAAVGAFAMLLLSGWRLSSRLTPAQFFCVGALNGVIVGATSFGAGALPFLYSGSGTAARNRATFIVWALFSALVGFGVVLAGGRFGMRELGQALLMMPAYLAGVMLGNRLADSVDDELLRRIVLMTLLVTAAAGLALNWV